MPTYNDDGLPLYSGPEAFPGWAAAFNSQSNLLSAALNTRFEGVQDDQAFPTIADLPDPLDSWPGRIVMIEENDMLYLFDGTGWYAFAGKSPYFYGSRTVSAVGTGASPQGYLTATDYSRGITRTGDTLTFATVGIYEVNQSVVWESNTSGQRNLGIDGRGSRFSGRRSLLLCRPLWSLRRRCSPLTFS